MASRSNRTSKRANTSVSKPHNRRTAICVKAEVDPLDQVKGQVKARLGDLAQNIDDPILKQAVKVRLPVSSE